MHSFLCLAYRDKPAHIQFVVVFLYFVLNVHKTTKIDGNQIDERKSTKYINFQVGLVNSLQIALWCQYNLQMPKGFEKYIKSTQ